MKRKRYFRTPKDLPPGRYDCVLKVKVNKDEHRISYLIVKVKEIEEDEIH